MDNQNNGPKGIPQDYDDHQQQENAGKSYAEATAENKEIAKQEKEKNENETNADDADSPRLDDPNNAMTPDERMGNQGL